MSYCKEVFAVWDKCLQHDLEGEPLCSGYGQVIMNILTGFLMKVKICLDIISLYINFFCYFYIDMGIYVCHSLNDTMVLTIRYNGNTS